MRFRLPLAVLVASAFIGALPAAAKCTRLGFSVNDYGKDGPTKDAKALLDKYIAKWAAEHNIAKYTVGKKDVKCNLFLDFIVFDEHTCRAEASVCWTEAPGQKPFTADGSAAAAPAEKPAAKPDKPAKPAKAAPKSAAAPGASPIETGTLPPGVKVLSPPSAVPTAAPAAPTPADSAVSAAEKAAAAAERAAAAAAAAEKAAAAAAKASTAAAPTAPATAPAAQPAAKE